MPYAAEGRISQEPFEGSIEISEAQYADALEGMLGGLHVQIVDGNLFIGAMPEPEEPVEPEEGPPTPQMVDAERNRRIDAGFTYSGVKFQTRATDRENILGSAQLAFMAIMNGAQVGDLRWADADTDFAWIAEDNSLVPMDAQTVVAFGKAAAACKQAHIFAARQIKDMEPIPDNYADDAWWPDDRPLHLEGRRVALLGDSLVEANGKQTYFEAYGFHTQAQRFSGQRLTYSTSDNFGQGGDGTGDMLARVPAIVAGDYDLVIGNGQTNDRTRNLSADDTIANIAAIRDQLWAGSRTPLIWLGTAPRGDGLGNKDLTPAQQLVNIEVRDRLRAGELNNAHCLVVDIWGVLEDPAKPGKIDPRKSHDLLHWNVYGATEVGQKALGPVIAALLPERPDLPPVEGAPGAVSVNAFFTGTGGQVGTGGTGQLARNWSGSSTTDTSSIVQRRYSKDDLDRQLVEIVATSAPPSTATIDILRQISLHSAMTVGKTYEVVGEFEIAEQSQFVLSLQVSAELTTSSGKVLYTDGDKYTEGAYLSPERQIITCQSPRFTVPAGLTDCRLKVSASLSGNGLPSMTVTALWCQLREVPTP